MEREAAMTCSARLNETEQFKALSELSYGLAVRVPRAAETATTVPRGLARSAVVDSFNMRP